MAPNKVRFKDGGIKIQGPIIHSTPGASGRWYSGYDTLTSSATDNVTSFELEWKQLQEPVRISRRELLQNKGDSAKISLLVSKMKIAEKNMTERIGTGLFSDGTADTGDATTNQFTGMAAILSESSTYAGLAVADVATWVANVNDNSSTDRAMTMNLLQQSFGECSIDSDQPTLLVSTQAVFDQGWALFQPAQRIMNAEMAKLGFRAMEFNGTPWVIDSHCPAGEVQFWNEDYLYMVVHKDEFMRIEKFEQLETFNGILHRINLMGNLVCDSRRLQGVLDDISVAS